MPCDGLSIQNNSMCCKEDSTPLAATLCNKLQQQCNTLQHTVYVLKNHTAPVFCVYVVGHISSVLMCPHNSYIYAITHISADSSEVSHIYVIGYISFVSMLYDIFVLCRCADITRISMPQDTSLQKCVMSTL